MDLVTFPQFSTLPKELRLEIWKLAFHTLSKHRIISLRDHIPSTVYSINIPRPAFTPNDRHVLLHTCIESRSVVLPILTSAFGRAKPGYQYIGKHKQNCATNFLESQGFTLEDSVGSNKLIERIPRTLEAMLVYYNAHPEEAAKHPNILQLGAPFPPLEPALWFDSKNDYLLLPMSRGDLMTATAPSWTTCGTLLASKVSRIAIEISRRDWDWRTHSYHAILPPSLWSASLESGEVELPLLDSVQEIALWTREGCEMCHFKIAPPSSSLKSGEWSFSLFTGPSIFEERFGERWSNVTWNVTFGRVYDETNKRQLNVCEMLRDWKPHSEKWWGDKLEVTRGVEGLGKDWKEMVQKWLDARGLLQDLGALNLPDGFEEGRTGELEVFDEENGVKTYLGPSFVPDDFTSVIG